MLPAGLVLTCICQEQAVSWEGCRVACQGLVQQLILVLLCQLPIQPQHSHPAILDLRNSITYAKSQQHGHSATRHAADNVCMGQAASRHQPADTLSRSLSTTAAAAAAVLSKVQAPHARTRMYLACQHCRTPTSMDRMWWTLLILNVAGCPGSAPTSW